ncbi:helix-turn-helix domain-containing protein [Burkholderia ubonensis]|uniref:helix-turn-helix domain-containing protein n=1 Tax=Burkholderia ubonensis TaxID=101571 RepID=UPI000AF92CCC|nr:helix-turn-helix transcriptional regulator [Burkholderia ubonensis]
MYESVRLNKGGNLPSQFDVAHDLCFVLHDLMAQLLVEGESIGLFKTRLEFLTDAERNSFEGSSDILEWLERSGRKELRAKILVSTVFPAVLSDLVHCLYEALECSRKGKLAVTYMLIRKPLQESLYILESIVIDRYGFVERLAEDPLKLRPHNAGGVGGHVKRVRAVLDVLDDGGRYDASYIAQLRYDKKASDSFDGICNRAMHLFTEHPAIRTERLSINFIFSDYESILSQWSYLYSRLPYLMFYILSLVERIGGEFSSLPPSYRDEIDRRLTAYLVMTWASMADEYRSTEMQSFTALSWEWLEKHCSDSGFRIPEAQHLDRMAKTGAFPEECEDDVLFRATISEEVARYHRERPSGTALFDPYNLEGEPRATILPHSVISRMVDGMRPIRAWREYLGVTQKEMATRLGISCSAYARLEKRPRPAKVMREKVAGAMGIDGRFLDL